MLAEVQGLVTRSAQERPRRTTSGLDGSRIALVLAVLDRHCGVQLQSADIFTSTVGGARLTEPASDLAVAVALASAASGAPAPRGVVAMGEIGLAGELRRVRDLPQRIAEAARLGFSTAVVPVEPGAKPGRRKVDGLDILAVDNVASALNLLGVIRSPAPARGNQRSPQRGPTQSDGNVRDLRSATPRDPEPDF